MTQGSYQQRLRYVCDSEMKDEVDREDQEKP